MTGINTVLPVAPVVAAPVVAAPEAVSNFPAEAFANALAFGLASKGVKLDSLLCGAIGTASTTKENVEEMLTAAGWIKDADNVTRNMILTAKGVAVMGATGYAVAAEAAAAIVKPDDITSNATNVTIKIVEAFLNGNTMDAAIAIARSEAKSASKAERALRKFDRAVSLLKECRNDLAFADAETEARILPHIDALCAE